MTATPEELRAHFSYDHCSGEIRWILPTTDHIRSGDKAGWVTDGGYLKICFKRRQYLGHRVAWAMYHGEWPVSLIDHVNGDCLDNRIVNLRLCNPEQNGANSRRRKDNVCGFKGVSFKPRHRLKFQARIRSGGKQVSLGSFATPEEAHEAYRAAAVKLKGDFANAG